TNAPTGTELIQRITPLDLAAREIEIVKQVLAGNIPGFLRRLCPIDVTKTVAAGTNVGTFYVTPDYLAVRSDDDYFLAPLSPVPAKRIADALQCPLPTRKMVDAIYQSASLKLVPQPIPPSPAMTTVPVFSNHNAMVKAQRAGALAKWPLGTLVAGHKKDVVISAKLRVAPPGKVAI